ncbi:YgaP family membrane protein [Microbacterium aurum]|uniref:YgaP family membrane protein n=1 Tax=Microbacterium aurum TaxID=36805 RepID=UPI0012F51EA6|nr:DUF2892 domain-containing protein [Microbacterium aurum]MBM7827063.1 hypothetical protein [Microbacterium aurum]
MPEPRALRSCAVSPAGRVVRAIAAVLVGAFALSMTGQPWCAIPAGICATLLAIGAITGWCPTDLLRTPQAETVEQNTLGFTDARQHIDIT